MKIKIKNRWNGNILFEGEFGSLRLALEAGVKANTYLAGAYLTGADLAGADLAGAYLAGADLAGADLTGADLTGAYLTCADLAGADLTGADLAGADLTGAYLTCADLAGAKSIPDSYKRMVRDDLWAILSGAPNEVAGLRQAIIDGRINGTTYSGECACLVGTIANVRGVAYETLDLIKPDQRRPAEQWFYQIIDGDTPETNPAAKDALEWIDQWLVNMQAAVEEARKTITADDAARTIAEHYAAEGRTHKMTWPIEVGGKTYFVCIAPHDGTGYAPDPGPEQPADAEPVGWASRLADGAWTGICRSRTTAIEIGQTTYGAVELGVPLYRHPAPSQGNAVAPQVVLEEIRHHIYDVIDAARRCNNDPKPSKEYYEVWDAITTTLARIIELPKPSVRTGLFDGKAIIADRLDMHAAWCVETSEEALQLAANCIKAAALLKSEGK